MNTFLEMPLAEPIQKALTALKFTEPTAIQKAVIPLAAKGKDFMACAETGSGKTAAYGLPLLSQLIEHPQRRGLVLAPTRELAQQIAEFLKSLSHYCDSVQVVTLVGGADIRKQFQALKRNPRIVVATPGRCIDHLKRGSLLLKSTEILVLDEGDRMLDMGFAPQLDQILKFLPSKRQTSLFTATMSEKVMKLAEKYLKQPERIQIGEMSKPASSIKQSVLQVGFRDKDNRIVDELNQRKGSIIVFARTQKRTESLAKNLKSFGFPVDLIHGGRSQGQRNQAIQNFRKGTVRILCATDIAARGLDVPQVEHVINFDLPMMSEDYIHRIGRTARNGAEGEALSFVMPEERRAWQSLVRKYKIQGLDLEMGPNKRDSGGGKKRTGGNFRKRKPAPRSRV